MKKNTAKTVTGSEMESADEKTGDQKPDFVAKPGSKEKKNKKAHNTQK